MLILHERPDVSINVETSAFNSLDTLDLRSTGIKMAFGIMDYKTRQVIDNHSKVEWHVYLETYKNLKIIEKRELQVHECTQ